MLEFSLGLKQFDKEKHLPSYDYKFKRASEYNSTDNQLSISDCIIPANQFAILSNSDVIDIKVPRPQAKITAVVNTNTTSIPILANTTNIPILANTTNTINSDPIPVPIPSPIGNYPNGENIVPKKSKKDKKNKTNDKNKKNKKSKKHNRDRDLDDETSTKSKKTRDENAGGRPNSLQSLLGSLR